LYFVAGGRRIVLLHGFSEENAKDAQREIATAVNGCIVIERERGDL